MQHNAVINRPGKTKEAAPRRPLSLYNTGYDRSGSSLFVRLPVSNDIIHGTDRHAVLFAESNDLRQTGHGAVRIGQFTQHATRGKSGQTRHVHSGLGMTATLQDSAGTGTQREDMAGAGDIGRHGTFGGSVLTVVTRSAADTPVVTPRAASMEMVNAVWYWLEFSSTIMGSSRDWTFSSVMHRQTMPLHSRISMAI